MSKSSLLLLAGLLGLAAMQANAKVSPEEAAKLKTTLTPLGAERAGNAQGTIPAWTGGLTQAPAGYGGPGSRYIDPFPQDKPKFTITAQNLANYEGSLTTGQIALFKKFPQTYKMTVYETRRTAANPEFIYEATYQNALNGQLLNNGTGIDGAVTGIPFPIPKQPQEILWNHNLRYRGQAVRRWTNQFAVTSGGSYNAVKIREDVLFAYSRPNIKPEDLNNTLLYFLQITTAPPRLAGGVLLVHEMMDQLKEPRRAWLYNPGQRRLRRAPNVAYDNPGTAADGLRTTDQTDMFNGALDRYDWKLLGKREIYIPYNSYKVHSDKLKYSDIVKPGHVNHDLTRYELHRVWVVDSLVKPTTSHIYKRRTFFVDEDSWNVVAVDVYDQRDQLWRVQEAHTVVAYEGPTVMPVLETIYDLLSNRYLAQALNNEDEESHEIKVSIPDFDPSNVIKQAKK